MARFPQSCLRNTGSFSHRTLPRGRTSHKPETLAGVPPPARGTPCSEGRSPLSFATLNSQGGPVCYPPWSSRQAGRGAPPLSSPAVTLALPSARGFYLFCVATSSAVDRRDQAPGICSGLSPPSFPPPTAAYALRLAYPGGRVAVH